MVVGVATRITGAAIFFFLLVHVLDTALVRVSPEAYNEVVGTYKTPIVGLMEMGLVAAVLYHALNGVRLILIDFWVKARDTSGRCRGPSPRCGSWSWFRPSWLWAPMWRSVSCDRRRGAWTPHQRGPRSTDHGEERPPRQPRPSARTAPTARNPLLREVRLAVHALFGVALVVLAIGHLFIGLMWDGGVYRIDFNYVAQRWASPFWQIWDMALLWLAVVHGANGMRTIIGDYARKNTTKFWLNSLLLLAGIHRGAGQLRAGHFRRQHRFVTELHLVTELHFVTDFTS